VADNVFSLQGTICKLASGHNPWIIDLGENQSAFIATPEKALLDLLYLTPGSDDPDYLRELRLQNSETLNTSLLIELADRFGNRKLLRAARRIEAFMSELEES